MFPICRGAPTLNLQDCRRAVLFPFAMLLKVDAVEYFSDKMDR